MTRASLVAKAIALAQAVRDSRALLMKAMMEEDVRKVMGLCDEILKRIGDYISSGTGGTLLDYQKIMVLAEQARALLERATTGRSQPPLRALQGSDDDVEGEGDAVEDEGEMPPNDDLDEKDESELDEDDDSSGARWPSDQPKLPSRKKPRRPATRKDADAVTKSLGSDLVYGVASARLAGVLTEDEALSVLLPVRRRSKDSAIANVATGGAR
jgi:hypothetical protein